MESHGFQYNGRFAVAIVCTPRQGFVQPFFASHKPNNECERCYTSYSATTICVSTRTHLRDYAKQPMFSSPCYSGQEINALHRNPVELNMWKHGQDDILITDTYMG